MAWLFSNGAAMKHSLRSRVAALVPRNIWILSAASFLTDLSSEMVIHLLPLFLANVIGARTVVVGLIEGVAQLASSFLQIASGRVSDITKRRKPLTVAGYAVSSIAKTGLLVARGWPLVLLVRLGDRLGKGIRTAPRDALIADSIGPDRRGIAFGLHRAADTAGAVVGLSVALLLVWRLQGTRITLARGTFQTAVAASLIPAFLAVVTLGLALRESPGDRTIAKARASATNVLRSNRALGRFLVVLLVFTLGNSTDAFLILRAQERGLAVTSVLLLLLVFNIVYSAGAIPASALSDRLGRKRLLVAGWTVYALTYVGFATVRATWPIWFLFAGYGCYYALTEGVTKAYVADLVAAGDRGTAYGLVNATVGLVTLPASVVAGLLWQGIGPWNGWGPAAPFAVGATLALLAVVLLIVLVPTGPSVAPNSRTAVY
jgi:MFS family permease